ncbi:helix-turn-helix domain-containing protein [Nesterenkonia sp. K-15-9-6]|uniref:helix-turn-helix domain-containing protein n=1 Tax=Nesterenkonia sp. K-15-9-6 TaxID=3093918 RepID=UPI0040440457
MSQQQGDRTTWRRASPGALAQQEPLWREVLGARLRRLRKHQGRTLHELAAEAGLSPQYLSEIERGRKEPSSEMIAAIAGALGIGLVDLTLEVADELRRDTLSFIGFAPISDLRTHTGPPPRDVSASTVVSLSAVA